MRPISTGKVKTTANGVRLARGARGRSILTGTEKFGVLIQLVRHFLDLRFGSVTLEWFDSTEAKAGSLFTKALFCPTQGDGKLKNSRKIEGGEHSRVSRSGRTNRKCHCSSCAGHWDDRWALWRNSNHGNLSEVEVQSQQWNQDLRWLVFYGKWIMFSPKF